MKLSETMLALRSEFAASGVRVAFDPSQIQPPCVMLGVHSARRDVLCDAWMLSIDFYCVAPGVRLGDSYAVLGSLIETVSAVVEPDSLEFNSVQFGDVYLPSAVLRAEIRMED